MLEELAERIEALEKRAVEAEALYKNVPGYLENGWAMWGMFTFTVEAIKLLGETAAALRALAKEE